MKSTRGGVHEPCLQASTLIKKGPEMKFTAPTK